ncbi:c-type cytochrome biogenesis protein CcmI [Candidatus Thioglobus sp.]|nr:c-type cytochrome biogenesis protein CcmI [Candidatus Thioglobus sp.]MDC0388507.1 c-type cytochrome biogenesis protein CcmI [Candidatus Thioglobus sp.]MDC0903889.1 c-type cytochrome biogenesis protein CcmI [Candidatus Thioglobus sp.]
MSMTIWFGVMLALSIAWVVWFLKRPLADNGVDLEQSNIDIAKQRKIELQADLAQGLIDQEQFEQALEEISNTLALELTQVNSKTLSKPNANIWIGVVVLLLPIFTISVYQNLSNYTPASKQAVIDLPPLTLEQSVVKIEQHLKENPQDVKAWKMLGLSYFDLNKIDESLKAYEKAYQIDPNDPRLLVEYASALISSNDDQFTPRPMGFIKKALEIEPNAPDALYLAGLFAANAQDFNLAKTLWNKALSVLPEQSVDRQALISILAELNRVESGDISNTITVNVVLSDEILASRSADDYLMIYAKAAQGRPMPIAIQKLPIKAFNGQVVLSDMNSVMSDKLLSQYDEAIVVVRISRTGGAMKQADDIQVASEIITIADNPSVTLNLK